MLPKANRLKRKEDFQAVFQRGQAVANRQFVCYTLRDSSLTGRRIGVSVSKKVGKAVVRNRVKRLMRESVRSMLDELPEGIDVVVIARVSAKDLDYHKTLQSLRHLFRKANLLPKVKAPTKERGQ